MSADQSWDVIRAKMKARIESKGFTLLDDSVSPMELSAGQLAQQRLSLLELIGQDIKPHTYNRKLLLTWRMNLHLVGDLASGEIATNRMAFIINSNFLALGLNQANWWQSESIAFQRLLVTGISFLEGNFTDPGLDPTIIIAVLSLELDTIQTLEDLGG